MLSSKNLISEAILIVLLLGLIQSQTPSINLWWQTNGPVHAIAVEVTATDVYDNTYWMAAGWHSGYSGFQQNKGWFSSWKMILFSIWTKNGNKSKFVNKDSRLYLTTFEGEGEGHSIRQDSGYFAEWQANQRQIFLVKAYQANQGTNIDLYVNKPQYGNKFEYFGTWWEQNQHPGKIKNTFSFLENFIADNGKRTGQYRAWFKTEQRGQWQPANSVQVDVQPQGKAVVKVVNRGDGDVISCTSGGSERYGGGLMRYNPGSIPTALAQSGF